MRRSALPLALVVLAAFGACRSSSSGSAATSTAPPTSLVATSAPPATAPSSTAAAGTSGPGGNAVTRCHTSQVDARIDTVEGAAGTIGVTFSLVNTSTTACTFSGFAGVGLRDASGGSLPDPVRDAQLPGGAAVALVTVAPGQAGKFLMTYNHVPSGSSPCPLATRVLVTPPDETVSITVTPTTPLDVCGNARIGPVTHV